MNSIQNRECDFLNEYQVEGVAGAANWKASLPKPGNQSNYALHFKTLCHVWEGTRDFLIQTEDRFKFQH